MFYLVLGKKLQVTFFLFSLILYLIIIAILNELVIEKLGRLGKGPNVEHLSRPYPVNFPNVILNIIHIFCIISNRKT